MDIFSERLRRAREDCGLTQAELGSLCEINETQISHYESGRRKPNTDNLKTLCLQLEISADYLLQLTDEAQIMHEGT